MPRIFSNLGRANTAASRHHPSNSIYQVVDLVLMTSRAQPNDLGCFRTSQTPHCGSKAAATILSSAAADHSFISCTVCAAFTVVIMIRVNLAECTPLAKVWQMVRQHGTVFLWECRRIPSFHDTKFAAIHVVRVGRQFEMVCSGQWSPSFFAFTNDDLGPM